jgi:hypothetical protein
MIEQLIFKANEVVVGNATPNTFTTNANGSAYAAPQANAGQAKMVCRILNTSATTPVLLTLANASFSGNLTMTSNSIIFLQKYLTDTLISNAAGNCLLGVVGYTY